MRSNRYCPFASRCNRRTRPDGSMFLCCSKPFICELWSRSRTRIIKKNVFWTAVHSLIWHIDLLFWNQMKVCVTSVSRPVWHLTPSSAAWLIGVWLTSWPLCQLEPVWTGCIFTQRNGIHWIFSLCESVKAPVAHTPTGLSGTVVQFFPGWTLFCFKTST